MQSKHFHTTNWSIVLRAGRTDDVNAREALTALCQRYWFPLYLFVRRKGIEHAQAEDLTQGFFARLIDKHALAHAVPSRGRFRSFMLTSLQNFLANEHDHAHAQKRGGDKKMLSLDVDASESKIGFEPAHDETPERVFDRAWALRLLEIVFEKLKLEFTNKGKAAEFEQLQVLLTGKNEEFSYEQAATNLGMSDAAVRQLTHRLRKRYRELLRAEVADTVADEEEIEGEIRSLFTALAN